LGLLALDNNHLTGAIPAQLGALTSLGTLDLGFNQLSGSIPPQLGNLPGLGYLGLNDNQLTGSLPPEIGSLVSLQGLRVEHNQLRGEFPASITNLADLNLFIFDCTLTTSNPTTAAFVEAISPDWKSRTCVPVVENFNVPAISHSLDIPINAFTAEEGVNSINGYMVTLTATAPAAGAGGWQGTAPTSFTVPTEGTYALYPWARDALGNVSPVFYAPRGVEVDLHYWVFLPLVRR